MKDLRKQLAAFDGKSVRPFREVAARLPATAASWRALCKLAATQEAAVQIGATWVLKNFFEQGHEPPRTAHAQILALFAFPLADDALLHLLQILPCLEVERDQEAALQRRLKQLIGSDNKFVRAWAYNGLALLAARNPRRRKGLMSLLLDALGTEAPSVHARIRNAMRELSLDVMA